MRYYKQKWERIMLAPDTDPTGGGNNPSLQNPGQQQQQGSSTTFVDPTAGLDLDDLDPAVRKVIEDSRAGFATLQKTAADAEAARQHEEKRRADWQSAHDKLKNQLPQSQQQQVDPKVALQNKFEQILVKRGVPENVAKIQAELMVEMQGEMAQQIKGEIGSDLRPFASSVLEREAQFAWDQATQTDRTGALQIPDVAQVVWDQVQEMVRHGQQVTPGVVQNLTGMAYFAALQEGKINSQQTQQQQQPPVQQQQQLPNVGRLTYPGAGNSPVRQVAVDPRAAKTVLDPDTDAALQAVFGEWQRGQGGVKAPGFRAPAKRGGR